MDSTLLKGLKVLETMAVCREPRGVTDLSAELKLLKSNVHRVLQTLLHAGYIRKEPDSGRYECTLKLWALGGNVADHLDARSAARPHMKELWERTGEGVHLAMLEGHEVLYIDRLESRHAVRVNIPSGGRGPAACISTGKILLAHADDRAIDFAAQHLKRYTTRTITDAETLRKELKKIKTTGYVVNRGEYREGVAGIGAPIFDGDGQAVAALGMSMPRDRLTASLLKQLLPQLLNAVDAISRDLGYGVTQSRDSEPSTARRRGRR